MANTRALRTSSGPMLRDSKSDLLEAAQAAMKDPAPASEKERTPTRAALIRRILLAALTTAAAVILVLRPVWLAGPKLPAETPEVRSASATMVLIEAASQVRTYQNVTGRLPDRLADAGIANASVQYRQVDAGQFELSLVVGDSAVSLRSTDSIRARATAAIRVLQGRS